MARPQDRPARAAPATLPDGAGGGGVDQAPQEFLLFTVAAPLASWGGEEAGSELRPTEQVPPKGAILGLLGAALGITRDEPARLAALGRVVRCAVRVDAPGVVLSDYHVAQTAKAAILARTKFTTRREMLTQARALETRISHRDYLQDHVCTIAIWLVEPDAWMDAAAQAPADAPADGPTLTLAMLEAALRAPVFVLSAGRKANVLSLPLGPERCLAVSLHAALQQRSPVPATVEPFYARTTWTPDAERLVVHDVCEHFPSGLRLVSRAVRRDVRLPGQHGAFVSRMVEHSIEHRVPAVDPLPSSVPSVPQSSETLDA